MSRIKIIFEDEQILVVNKPAGLVVNRSETTREETLQDQLSEYFHLKPGDLGVGERAGIVHRLDRETSGVLVVAKTQKAFDFLQRQFQERKVAKEYIALVHGFLKDKSGSIAFDIGRIGKFGKFGVVDMGRASETDFKVIRRYKFKESSFNILINQNKPTKARINYLKNHAHDYTLVSVFPKTGRTHQVRVHLKGIGHSVVTDSLYAPNKLLKFDRLWCERLFLHAKRIDFTNLQGKRVVFEVPLPYDLIKAQGYLKKLPDG